MDQPQPHSAPRVPSLPRWRADDDALMGEEEERDAPAIKTLRRLQVVTDAALLHLSLAELERDLLERIRALLCGDVAMILLLSEDGNISRCALRAASAKGSRIRATVTSKSPSGAAGRNDNVAAQAAHLR
jgi:hypothetical protein